MRIPHRPTGVAVADARDDGQAASAACERLYDVDDSNHLQSATIFDYAFMTVLRKIHKLLILKQRKSFLPVRCALVLMSSK
ncbi:hypothetical protein [Sphingomonas sp. VDB2]|uniref:hypothetical protein n=1 Tax=Sphingomonas sp. VDB2 TaxID=3228751 RepID=UPI003A809730